MSLEQPIALVTRQQRRRLGKLLDVFGDILPAQFGCMEAAVYALERELSPEKDLLQWEQMAEVILGYLNLMNIRERTDVLECKQRVLNHLLAIQQNPESIREITDQFLLAVVVQVYEHYDLRAEVGDCRSRFGKIASHYRNELTAKRADMCSHFEVEL